MLEFSGKTSVKIKKNVTTRSASYLSLHKSYQELFNSTAILFLIILGMDGTQRLFRRHIKKLKDEQLAKKVAHYMEMLPDILHELVPDINTFTDR